jgi:hypothetical protein
MGDFNAVVGNLVDSDAVGKYGLGTRVLGFQNRLFWVRFQPLH